MAEKVEVVIKIPKYYLTYPQDYSCLAECVRRGIILPKGHGRLIDADKLLTEINAWCDCKEGACLIKDALTIIEADTKREKEE